MLFNRLVEAPGVVVLVVRSLLALARGRRGLAPSILPPAVTAALLAATVLALSATPVRAQDSTPTVVPEISLKAKFGGYDPIDWPGGDVFWAGDDVVVILTRCDPATGDCSGFLAPELAVTLEVVTQDPLTDAVTERRDVSVTFAADEYTAEMRIPTTAATEPRARYWLKVELQEAAGYTINAREQFLSGEVHAPFPQTVSITADADTVSEGEDARFTLKRCVHPIFGRDLIDRSACFDEGLPDLTVDVTVTGEGQTIDGTPPAQVTFAAGTATASLAMPTATDDLYEDTLAVTAAIAAPGAGNNAYELGAPANAAVKVANTTPLPTISANPAAGNEGDGAIEFHVSLSPVSAVPATVAYATSDVTAKAGEDYTAAAGTLTFEPGVTSQTIRVEVTEDYLHEPDETFFITLSNPRGAQHINEAFQGRIRANPVSTVTITGPEAVVEGETVTVTLTRTQTQGGLDVNLGYTNGSDAQFSGTPPATARFEHGRSETTSTFATVDNPRLLRIGEENWVLAGVNRGEGYTIGFVGEDFVHITVTDNDVPTVSIEAAGYSPSGWPKYPVIWAGDDAVFTLKRCDPATGECSGFVAPALTVNLLRRIVTGTNQVEVQDASQTATFDAGAYTAEVRVPTAEAEQKGFQSEQIMSVRSGAGYNGVPGSRSVSLEVHAPYPQRVSIAPAAAQVNEGENVDFTLTRCAHPNDEPVCFDEGLPALTVAVSVTDEGKVLSGAAPAQVTFAAGSATASLTMPTATDDLYEETLAVTAAIAAPGAGNNAYELGAPSSAAVKVANTTPLPTISTTSAGASEEDGAIEFAVSLSPPSGVTATVDYGTVDRTAKTGEDFTAAAGTLIFAPGQTDKTVRVEVTADYDTEGAETFTLILSNPQHARFEGGETIWYATGTIQAETAPTLSLTLTNQAPPGASEPTIIPGQPLQWRLVREGDASAELAVVLRYRVRAARVSGGVGEWTEGSIRQTFPAGQTSIDGSATVNAEELGWDGEIHGEGALRIATPEETSNEIGRRILYRIDPDASSGSFGIEHETPMVVVENRQDEVAAGDEAEFQLVRFGEFDNALTATVEFSGAFAGPARRDIVFPPGTEIVRFKLWSRLPATDSDDTTITASLAESTAYRTTTGGIEGDSNYRQSQISVVDNGLPIVFIETDNDFAFEGSPVVFLLTRQAGSYSTPLTVSVKVTDLRGSLVDEPPTEVRFSANSRRATLRLNTGSDSLIGMSDHVTATLNPGSGYRIPAPGDPSYEREASVTVRDNDVAGPTISYVSIVSDTGSDDVYDTNEPIWAHVTFNETAVVEGRPSLGLEFGDGDAETDAQAVYESGSGSSVLKFRYYPQPGDRASSGITIPADSLQLNGGEIADRSDNAAILTHTAVSSSHRVNALPLATVTVDYVSPTAAAPSITVGDDDTTIRVRLRLTRTGDTSNELPVELYYGNTHIDFVDGKEYIDGRRAIRVINVFPVDDRTIEVEVTGEVTGYWGWLTDEGKVSAGGKLEFQIIPWMGVFHPRAGGYVSDADRYNLDLENRLTVHLRNQLPLVTIEPAWPEANEGDDAVFTLTRYGDGLAAPRDETLTVTVNVTGAGGVYNGPAQRTVTFEAGAETAELRIPTRAVESIGTMGTVTAALASSPTVYRLTDKVWDSGSRFDRATVDVAGGAVGQHPQHQRTGE